MIGYLLIAITSILAIITLYLNSSKKKYRLYFLVPIILIALLTLLDKYMSNRESEKQQGSLQADLTLLKEKYDSLHTVTINVLTGGDGFIKVSVFTLKNSGEMSLQLDCYSKYTIYDISVYGYDYSKQALVEKKKGKLTLDDIRMTTISLNSGNMTPNRTDIIQPYILDEGQNNIYLDLQISTRSGVFREQFNVINVNSNTERELAVQIFRMVDGKPELIHSQITLGFPLDKNGNPVWTQ